MNFSSQSIELHALSFVGSPYSPADAVTRLLDLGTNFLSIKCVCCPCMQVGPCPRHLALSCRVSSSGTGSRRTSTVGYGTEHITSSTAAVANHHFSAPPTHTLADLGGYSCTPTGSGHTCTVPITHSSNAAIASQTSTCGSRSSHDHVGHSTFGGGSETPGAAPTAQAGASPRQQALLASWAQAYTVDADDTPLQLLQPSQLLQQAPQLTQAATVGTTNTAATPCYVREARQSIGTFAQFLAGQLTDAALDGFLPACSSSRVSSCRDNHTSISGCHSRLSAAGSHQSAAAMLVPTEPASIFEASIAARPNFEARQQPPSCWYYQLVNALILCVLVAGAVVELTTGKEL
jgi:hypothetical protein